MGKLADFLLRNSVQPASALPPVHTTQAYHIRTFKDENVLKAAKCDVFSENLNYFFMGRPAYKKSPATEPSEPHEFPCCLIFEYSALKNVKRIFPFDSGAFEAGLFPSSTSMMNISDFEVAAVDEAPAKIIGAFFGTAKDYFMLNGDRNFAKKFDLNPLDFELKALNQLATQKPSKLDDRRFAIEIQNSSDVDLTIQKPLAVVAPSQFLDYEPVRDHIQTVWGAKLFSYPLFPINQAHAIGQIYQVVWQYYQAEGYI